MLELRDDSDVFADDPVVRRTIGQLRMSVAAVVLGIACCIMLAGLVAAIAFKDGVKTGAQTALAPTPEAAGRAATASSARPGRADRAARQAAVRQATAREKRLAEAQARSPRQPGVLTFGVLLVGFLAAGLGMFLVVRRPYANARGHAVELARAYRTLQDSTLETFAALNATVEAKDRYTAGHGLRVTLISLLIGQEMDLDEQQLDALRHAATFHDIGKIAVPDSVLQKKGRLTDAEFDAMKIHPVESARIASKLASLRDSVPAIRSHHERIDGGGYPDGLRGEEIPLGARIIAVADTWDAITSDRPYRRGQPATLALDEIRRVSGTQFDPRVVRAFHEVLARDPWMFGLTPADVLNTPAAPGQQIEHPSRAVDELVAQVRSLATEVDAEEIDWSSGFDEEDLAA